MTQHQQEWQLELPLTEVGYFKAKAYAVDPKGWQHWPEGPDIGISVHPDSYRTANTIYCAFTRMFGPTKTFVSTQDEKLENQFRQLDRQGYTVIPPSGKLRDLIQQLPHIIDTLGCRILHLVAGQSHAHDLCALRPLRQPLCQPRPDRRLIRRSWCSTAAQPGSINSTS